MNSLYRTFLIISIAFASCSDDLPIEESVNPEDFNDTWEISSHSNDAEPDYSVVFPQDKVLRFDITISYDYWSSMESDLAENLTTSGPGGGGPGRGAPVDTDSDFKPIWVPCNMQFNNSEWHNVGIRFKGNSSLSSVYNSNIDKFSFKLDFDEFEDDYPEIKNQRFYGFKQLNLNNNFGDYSEMHEKIAPELFREFGLVSSQTAFVALYIDFGNGPQFFGLYTLVEEVDDTVLGSQYSFSSGNLYKPEGTGATFAQGTFNTADMYLKTNEDEADYSDVETLYNVINSDDRLNNPDFWQEELETVLDVSVFLRWLAANTVIQNWDTYGRMNHNYYLYNNPSSNKIEWIPWDNNEAFNVGKQEGAINIDLSDVTSGWPLITNIAKIQEYKEQYDNYLEEFVTEVFYEQKMLDVYNTYYDLIYEYVRAEDSEYSFTTPSNFKSEVESLKQHVAERSEQVEAYLQLLK
ncbi:MAG: CotH kinase family protein [Salinivirgaceae bacterium]|jgi:spore coat protein H|nr:CotH kinase family protein [Salinivirgaceae bacterium]